MFINAKQESSKPTPIHKEISEYQGSNNSAKENDMHRLRPHSFGDI